MNNTTQTLKIFWQHACKYPSYLVGLAIVMPLGTLFLRIFPPLIAAGVVQRLSVHDYTDGDFWGSFGTEIILYTILSIAGGVILMRLEVYLAWKLETYVNRDLLRTMFNHYMKLDAGFHADRFGGSLVSRANKLMGAYIRMADTIVFQLMPLIIGFIAIIFVMYPKSPLFVWIYIIFCTIFIWLTFIFSKRVRVLAAEEADAENKNTGALADAVTNIMAIKSFSSSKSEKKRFAKVTDFSRHRAVALMMATIKRDFVASIITTGIGVMALAVAAAAIVAQNSDLAVVFLMLTYATYISEKLWEFQSSMMRNFNRSIGDAQKALSLIHI